MFKRLGEVLPTGGEVYKVRCPHHGDQSAFAMEGSKPQCPICQGEKMRREAERSHAQERAKHLLDHADIPRRYQNANFNNWEHMSEPERLVKRSVWRWVLDKDRGNLILTGAPGTGKTHLAAAAMNKLMHEQLIGCKYMTAYTMLSLIREAYRDYAAAEGKSERERIVHIARSYPVLCVDEADIHKGSERDLALLFQVVNERYNERKPIILISNQPAKTMQHWLDMRQADRLREGAMELDFTWESKRKTGAGQ